jgi:predicted transcriptional regulator
MRSVYYTLVVAMAGDPDQLEKLLGPLESEVVRAVWRLGGPVTVGELRDHLNSGRPEPLAYTTVMTVMSRLVDKGVLTRERAGRGYLYRALVDDPAALAVRNLLRDFGDAAVAHFVDEARTDPETVKRLRRLLESDG